MRIGLKEVMGKSNVALRGSTFLGEGTNAEALRLQYAWNICDTAKRTMSHTVGRTEDEL